MTDSADGIPIEGGRVWLMSPQCDFLTYDTPDANGDYSITGFEAGTYYLIGAADHADYITKIYPNENRMDVCYPNIQDGQAIIVGELEQLGGFDFALDPGGSISGFVSDSSGILPPWDGGARLYDLDGRTLRVYRNTQPDGSYRMGGVILQCRTGGRTV